MAILRLQLLLLAMTATAPKPQPLVSTPRIPHFAVYTHFEAAGKRSAAAAGGGGVIANAGNGPVHEPGECPPHPLRSVHSL